MKPFPLARRFRRDKRGSVALEAGLSAPLMMLLLAGVGDFGSVLYAHHVVQTGLTEAARHLARVDDPTTVEATARRLAVTGSMLDGREQRLAYWTGTDITIEYRTLANPADPTTGLRAQRGGEEIRVARVSTTITVPTIALHAILGKTAVQVYLVREQRVVGE